MRNWFNALKQFGWLLLGAMVAMVITLIFWCLYPFIWAEDRYRYWKTRRATDNWSPEYFKACQRGEVYVPIRKRKNK